MSENCCLSLQSFLDCTLNRRIVVFTPVFFLILHNVDFLACDYVNLHILVQHRYNFLQSQFCDFMLFILVLWKCHNCGETRSKQTDLLANSLPLIIINLSMYIIYFAFKHWIFFFRTESRTTGGLQADFLVGHNNLSGQEKCFRAYRVIFGV